MVTLPSSPKTMKTYMRSSTADVCVTNLVEGNLTVEQCKIHLIVDEAAIKPVETYVKNVDKLLGHVDMAGVVQPSERGALTNKLVNFALSKSLLLIIGYFQVKKLKATELVELTKDVIKEIEKLDYEVFGLVSDNALTNTNIFKLLNPDGKLCHEIPHPIDKKIKFFLSIDSSHIIKMYKISSSTGPLNGIGNTPDLITSSDSMKTNKSLAQTFS